MFNVNGELSYMHLNMVIQSKRNLTMFELFEDLVEIILYWMKILQKRNVIVLVMLMCQLLNLWEKEKKLMKYV